MDSVESLILSILDAVTSAVASLLGFLPNPDPFPEILDNLTVTATDGLVVAYSWLDTFFIADVVINMLGLWLLMFPMAWVIMWLWKWIKAR